MNTLCVDVVTQGDTSELVRLKIEEDVRRHERAYSRHRGELRKANHLVDKLYMHDILREVNPEGGKQYDRAVQYRDRLKANPPSELDVDLLWCKYTRELELGFWFNSLVERGHLR